MPSLLAVVAAAALVSVFTADIAGPRAGLIAGVLFALMPAVSGAGITARPAALGMFFVALAMVSLRRAIATGRPWWFALHFAAVLCLCYVTLLSAPLVVGFAPFVLLSRHRGRIAAWLMVVAAAFALAIPVFQLTHRQSGLQSWIPQYPWAVVPGVLGTPRAARP